MRLLGRLHGVVVEEGHLLYNLLLLLNWLRNELRDVARLLFALLVRDGADVAHWLMLLSLSFDHVDA